MPPAFRSNDFYKRTSNDGLSKENLRRFSKDRCTTLAAALAYYTAYLHRICAAAVAVFKYMPDADAARVVEKLKRPSESSSS
ncbi:hypothetical protein NZK35_20185 [Stieleria sp. ICT_E10.1]|uniref:hypothetical protein n=1 Tax=Stieleria sedimenti TaxID=2976331 RepID=UPI002180548C|nr:hypothetical protein [Stieleria sedimenti]MCS7468978.1 hypothetical protein [Stieleria sedimenti]